MVDPYALIDKMAFQAIDEHRKKRPVVFASYKGQANDHCIQDTKYHLTFLFDSASIDSPQLFINYVAWARVLLKHIAVTPEMFKENLEHIREQCRAGLDGEFGAKVDEIMGTTLEQYDSMPDDVQPFIDESDRFGTVALSYLENVLRGRRREAQEVICKALQDGMGLKDIYLKIFQRTQYEVGRRWQHRNISIAQEHYVTGVTQQLMSQIYPSIFSNRSSKGTLIVTCVGNELHEMGARMVADFLELDGWDADYLGSNTPDQAVISIIKERNAKILLASATMGFNVKNVSRLIQAVRRDPGTKDVKIVVGGYPFNSVDGLWRSVGADAFARDAEDAVGAVKDLHT